MKSFRATFIPRKWVNGEMKPDESKSRIVLVLKLGEDEEGFHAFFIDSDNTLKVASLNCFTNCQSIEWGER